MPLSPPVHFAVVETDQDPNEVAALKAEASGGATAAAPVAKAKPVPRTPRQPPAKQPVPPPATKPQPPVAAKRRASAPKASTETVTAVAEASAEDLGFEIIEDEDEFVAEKPSEKPSPEKTTTPRKEKPVPKAAPQPPKPAAEVRAAEAEEAGSSKTATVRPSEEAKPVETKPVSSAESTGEAAAASPSPAQQEVANPEPQPVATSASPTPAAEHTTSPRHSQEMVPPSLETSKEAEPVAGAESAPGDVKKVRFPPAIFHMPFKVPVFFHIHSCSWSFLACSTR